MIAIENTLISDDIFTEFFCCDLNSCKGCCCVEGDAGAPLNEDEIAYLEEHIDTIRPYLTEKGSKVVEDVGVFEVVLDGLLVTPLVERAECAYLTFEEGGIAKCAIEKAFEDGKTDFQKPISCHLYPIRISCVGGSEALNYDRWPICKDAVIAGSAKSVKVFQFLKTPLIRKYGEEWYQQLLFAEEELFEKKIR